jgi:hypothetical protein
MRQPYAEYYKIILQGSEHRVFMLKRFTLTNQWIAYYKSEENCLATYDGLAPTPEEALDKFIRYRINCEPPNPVNLTVSGMVAFL